MKFLNTGEMKNLLQGNVIAIVESQESGFLLGLAVKNFFGVKRILVLYSHPAYEVRVEDKMSNSTANEIRHFAAGYMYRKD